MGVTLINLNISLSLRPKKMIEKNKKTDVIEKTSQSPPMKVITVNLPPNIPVNDDDIKNEDAIDQSNIPVGKEIGMNFTIKPNMFLAKSIKLPQILLRDDEPRKDTILNDFNKISPNSKSKKNSKTEDELVNRFDNLSLKKDVKKIELLKKLFDILKKPKTDLDSENNKSSSNYQGVVYKPRGPIKSIHKERLAPYGVPDLTVSAHHGGGVVFIEQPSQEPVEFQQKIEQYIQKLLADKELYEEFLDYFSNLSDDEINSIATTGIDEVRPLNLDQQYSVYSPPEPSPPQMYPAITQYTLSPSPYTQLSVSPGTSPNHSDPHDSSYETGSPGSSVVTSPGSPRYLYSPTRNSISDQELSPRSVFDQPCVKTVKIVHEQKAQVVPCRPKTELVLRPLGETVHCNARSAEQQLEELSRSTAWERHYLVQLVLVAIATKKNPNNSVEGFKENLMKTMKTQLEERYENIGLLAIFAHLEFLKAPGREEYKSALLVKDERKFSLLYIAAVERRSKLLARYIAEIMAQVGYNPLEVDINGNTVLHVLASLGDSHVDVLIELLAASNAKTGQKLFNVAKTLNKDNQSPLHIAVRSPLPHTTTVVQLLSKQADPLLQDNFMQTPLHYHIKASAGRAEGGCVQPIDLELTKKLLPFSCSRESTRKLLDTLCSDPTTPPQICNLIKKRLPEKR